jgi:hypothetical protein
MKGQQLGVPFISDDDDWVANCVEKEYIPVLEDVGCVLKVSYLCRSIFDVSFHCHVLTFAQKAFILS